MMKPWQPRPSGTAAVDGPDGRTSSRPRRIMVPAAMPVERALLDRDSKESVWARKWAVRLGGTAESAAYLASVTAWRNAWRPERVRVLLVAESHVAELRGDIEVSVAPPAWAQRHLPTSFCRLIYCLGYGESEICSPAPAKNSTGTLGFWDIFGAIAGGLQPMQPRRGASTPEHRLQWKLDVLSWLRRNGVWLVDACVAGVYLPGGRRMASGETYNEMVRQSFDQFVWPSVSNEHPEQVWVIGSGVRQALAHHKAVRRSRWITQPQDRNRGRHQRGLVEMVTSLRKLVPPRP